MASTFATEITRLTLSANTETVIQYDRPHQLADIVNNGPGEIYLNWRKAASVGDLSSLKLIPSQTYELRTSKPWTGLSIIGTQAAEVQVVIL